MAEGRATSGGVARPSSSRSGRREPARASDERVLRAPTMRDNGGVSDIEQPEPASEVPGGEVPGAEASEPRVETEVSQGEVVVRRSPRYGAFMLLGAIVGAIVAFVLSYAFAPSEAQIAERVAEDFTYDQGQVFGFLLLGGVAVFGALGAVVALIVDRSMARRATRAVAEHDATRRVDE